MAEADERCQLFALCCSLCAVCTAVRPAATLCRPPPCFPATPRYRDAATLGYLVTQHNVRKRLAIGQVSVTVGGAASRHAVALLPVQVVVVQVGQLLVD